jgi:hypothetical protein
MTNLRLGGMENIEFYLKLHLYSLVINYADG